MNCEYAQNQLTLYGYDELADDLRFELEQHLERCPNCTQEWVAVKAFHEQMTVLPALEPSPNLLAASRLRLTEALESAEQHKGWRRLVFDPALWLRQHQFSAALAAAVLLVGFTGGVLTTFSILTPPLPVGGIGAPQPAIASISGITQQPGSKSVSIQYDTLQPQSVQGSVDDPRIEQLLLYASRNQENAGVRVDSINLLSQKSSNPRVREALMYSLRYDKNPGVRLKALTGLQNYVQSDIRVRDAVTEVLLYDANEGVRTEALRLLQPVKADGSVRAVLQHLAQKDANAFIRRESARMLASVANID
jgi:hypothetical protein